MADRQQQKAGSDSTQYQVSGDLHLHQGISEERATEIVRAQLEVALSDFHVEAVEVGRDRIEKFDKGLVEELNRNALLSAFADPAFVVLIRKAQLTAASTDRTEDYEVLVRLLNERASTPSKRISLAVDKAVQIVHELDDSAICGLTASWIVISVKPEAGLTKHGLDLLENISESVIAGCGPLPEGNSWLSDLDVADCLRSSRLGIGRMKPYEQILTESIPTSGTAGFNEEARPGVESLLAQLEVDATSIIKPHPLLTDKLHLAVSSEGALRDQLFAAGKLGSSQRISVLDELVGKSALGTSHASTAPALRALLDQRPALRDLCSWWDALNGTVDLTPVGNALAYSNAKRFHELKGLPALYAVL